MQKIFNNFQQLETVEEEESGGKGLRGDSCMVQQEGGGGGRGRVGGLVLRAYMPHTYSFGCRHDSRAGVVINKGVL